MAFDPDAFLAKQPSGGFDPDAFLAKQEPSFLQSYPAINSLVNAAKPYAQTAVDSLPMLGGVVGGILGTPADVLTGPAGTAGGAAIGGYLGMAAKDAINSYTGNAPAPQTTSEALLSPVVGGLEQGAGQAIGEGVVGPALSKAAEFAEPVTGPIADYLKSLSNRYGVASTGATGIQAAKILAKNPNAGSDLVDQGIVGFGDSQAQIAAKAKDALGVAGQNIGDILSQLDDAGALVKSQDIIDALRARAKELGKSEANMGVASGLNSLADQIEEGMTSGATPAARPLSEIADVKRGFQAKGNYNLTNPYQTQINNEVGSIYKNAIDEQAVATNPQLAEQLDQNNQAFGNLKPVVTAATKRANTTAQSPPFGIQDMITAGSMGGAIGSLSHSPVAGVASGAASIVGRRIVGPRINSSLAVGADFLSNIVKTSPEWLGDWAAPLTQAAENGPKSLAVTDYILQQTDPGYRAHMDKIRNATESGENGL
jgi:hypothetical protein